MDFDDYLRYQAANYRQLAEAAESETDKEEYLDLAATCEEVANEIEAQSTDCRADRNWALPDTR